MKRIVSLWLPAWPIERMARALPAGGPRDLLLSSPFALVAPDRGALRIHAVSPPARAGGIRPGQALADARAVLPALATRPAEPERDDAALIALARWAGRYGPGRHVDGADGIWIDATGVAHLYGGEERLAGDLYARLTRLGLTARIALAATPGAAHALARYATAPAAPVRCVPADAQALAAALAPLPVAALRLDADQVVLARRLGLKRIGQLYGLPRDSLARRFRSQALAEALLARLDAALGRKSEPRASLAEPPPRAVARTFAEPLISAEAIAHALAEACHELTALLQAQGTGLRRARLSLARTDRSAVQIMVGTAAPVTAAAHLMDLFAGKLETVDAGFGIDTVTLQALAVEAATAQQTALTVRAPVHGRANAAQSPAFDIDAGAGHAARARLIDRLANRLGSDRVLGLAPAPRHIPEHAQVRRPLLGMDKTPDRMQASAAAACDACHPAAPRPALLLASPEPISVMAEVPDGPPLRFTWRRVEHRVVAAEGPERIAPAWWRALPRPPQAQANGARNSAGEDDPAAAALGERVAAHAPRTRDYYRVEDQEGGRYWVFRDGLYGRDEDGPAPTWFLHAVFT